ncbi:MAG: hypothetical protein R3Y56_01160 [Akkermansia sp.]
MNNHDFQHLDAKARHAFDAMGIKCMDDLLHQPISQTWSDLEKLGTYFPEHQSVITRKQLEQMYASAQAATPGTAITIEPAEAPAEPKSQERRKIMPVFKAARGSRQQRKEEGKIHHHRHTSTPQEGYSKSLSAGRQNKNNAQRSRKSFKTYVAALLTVVMTPTFVLALIGLIVSIFTDFYIEEVAIGVVAYTAIYVIFLFLRLRIRCQVCRIPTFSLKDYPHNKHAHDWLFFGPNYSTAFHIVFCLWYRCPACGTAVQVFKPKHKQ